MVSEKGIKSDYSVTHYDGIAPQRGGARIARGRWAGRRAGRRDKGVFSVYALRGIAPRTIRPGAYYIINTNRVC